MLPVFQGDDAEGGVEITLADLRHHRALLETSRFFYEHIRSEAVLSHSDVMAQWNDIGRTYTGELEGEDARVFHQVRSRLPSGDRTVRLSHSRGVVEGVEQTTR